MSDQPSAAARVWDVAALVLAGGGAALYFAAHAGMKGILATQVHAATIEAPNITRWVHYRTMSNIGLGLVVAGVAVGITAYIRSRRETVVTSTVPDVPPLIPPNAPQE
jgi:hypothetical protein